MGVVFFDISLRNLLICCVVLFAMSGCGPSRSTIDQWMAPSNKIKVLSTTAMVGDVVEQVGGNRIDHITLIEGGIDPHSYELVKGDDEKLSCAKVVFSSGLGLEHGASLRYRLDHHDRNIALGDQIHFRHPNAVLSDRGQTDPHIWLDVSLWVEIVDPIVETLSAIDPEGSLYYEQQGVLAKDRLLRLDQSILETLHKISPSKRYLVTSHDAFNYFARRYLTEAGELWKTRFCAPEGLSPDGQLNAQDLQGVIDYIALHQVSVIFPESNVSRDSLRKIVSVCVEKGWNVVLAPQVLYSDSFGPSCTTYEEMMYHNAVALSQVWNAGP